MVEIERFVAEQGKKSDSDLKSEDKCWNGKGGLVARPFSAEAVVLKEKGRLVCFYRTPRWNPKRNQSPVSCLKKSDDIADTHSPPKVFLLLFSLVLFCRTAFGF
jgi:hypothetical protein